MEWREEGLEGKLVGQVARRSRLSRIRAPGGKFVDARGVGVAEGDSPLHKMPIVVDSSQEFGTAITPLMEPPLHGGRSRKRWKLDGWPKGPSPFELWRFVFSCFVSVDPRIHTIYIPCRPDLRSFAK